MVDFMTGLLDLVFYLFDKTDNLLVVIPASVAFFLFCFLLVGRLVRRF